MNATTNGFVNRLARGAVGGLAGTVALQGLRMASERYLPQSMPPMEESPDDFMVEQAEEHMPAGMANSIPPIAEKIAGTTLAIGYGALAGALCSMLGFRKLPNPLRGAALGVTTWATGYLGWLPLLGLMPSVRKQTPSQVAGPLVRHVVYGIVSVEVSELLRRAFDSRATIRSKPARRRSRRRP